MFARHRVVPSLASTQVLACLATIAVTPLDHDNRGYNIYWAGKYRSLLPGDTLGKTSNLETSANKTMARNLRGRPLLMGRRWDYSVQYLMGATPPDNREITRPPAAAGGPGGGSPDNDPSSWR